MTDDYRDHDHRVEELVDDAFCDPAPENQHAAQVAVAELQRRHDHLLRRLDGDGELPEFPVHQHNPANEPENCAIAVLYELAGAKLTDRAETLAHGLEAVNTLARQVEVARDLARWLWNETSIGTKHAVGDTGEWPWLTEGHRDTPSLDSDR